MQPFESHEFCPTACQRNPLMQPQILIRIHETLFSRQISLACVAPNLEHCIRERNSFVGRTDKSCPFARLNQFILFLSSYLRHVFKPYNQA